MGQNIDFKTPNDEQLFDALMDSLWLQLSEMASPKQARKALAQVAYYGGKHPAERAMGRQVVRIAAQRTAVAEALRNLNAMPETDRVRGTIDILTGVQNV